MRITEVIHTRILQHADVGENQVHVRMMVEKKRLLRFVRLARHDVVNLPVRRANDVSASGYDPLQEKAEDASATAAVADLDLPLPIVQGLHGALEVPLERLHLRRRDIIHDVLGQRFVEGRAVRGELFAAAVILLRLFYAFYVRVFCFR